MLTVSSYSPIENKFKIKKKHSLFQLDNIALYVYTTVCLSFRLLIDI